MGVLLLQEDRFGGFCWYTLYKNGPMGDEELADPV